MNRPFADQGDVVGFAEEEHLGLDLLSPPAVGTAP